MTTHNTARNQFIDIAGTHYAYRRFGKPTGLQNGPHKGVPLLLLQHFIGTMDWWDPRLVDGLAASREIILLDNKGVGISGGETPNRIEAMAADVHAVIQALGLSKVDILGFSMGGFIAQELALTYPADVRKLLLVGTGPRGGEGMQERRADVAKALSLGDHNATRAYLFFTQSAASQAAASAFFARTAERKIDLDPESSKQTMQAQGEAIGDWGLVASRAGHLAKLGVLTQPTLVVNGNDDIMVPTANSSLLFHAISRAQLVLYPDAGHGALFQYPDLFVEHARLFLDRSDI